MLASLSRCARREPLGDHLCVQRDDNMVARLVSDDQLP